MPPVKFIELLRLKFPFNNPTKDMWPGSDTKSSNPLPPLPDYWYREFEQMEQKIELQKKEIEEKNKIISNQNDLIDNLKLQIKANNTGKAKSA